MAPRSTRRRRLAAALLGFGLAATAGAVGLPSPAVAIPTDPGPCAPDRYVVQVDHGQVLAPTEPTQIVYNGNPGSIPVTFSSSQSGTVSSTASSSVTFTGGIKIGIVNSSVSITLGISVTHSATTTIGVSVGPMTLLPGYYQYGEYGVWRRKTTGTYYNTYVPCLLGRPGQIGPITAYSVTGVGWRVWQDTT